MSRSLPPAIVEEQVTVKVKWFNPTKGFGFVVPVHQENSDAFLHASVLPVEDANSITEGVTLICDLAEGQKGLMVATVHSIDTSTAAPSHSGGGARGGFGGGGFGGGGGYGGGRDRPPRHSEPEATGPTQTGEGTVKFFNDAKGFGFVSPDGGGPDIFISGRILGHAGLQTLESDQRVRFESRQGERGPMAEKIETI